jgi:hypothetical protein
MFSLRVVTGVSIGFLAISTLAHAYDCPNPYERTLPFVRDIGGDKAAVYLKAEAGLSYDCQVFSASSFGEADVELFKIKAQVINARAATTHNGERTQLNGRVTTLGYEIKSISRDVSTVYEETFRPNRDIDLSKDMTVMVGPVPVSIRYGVEGVTGIRVKAGFKNFGSNLHTSPFLKTAAYLQGGIDVKIIKASARGDLLLVDGKLPTDLSVYFDRSAKAPTIAYTAHGDILADTLQGSAKALLEVKLGDETKSYERDLFAWNGETISGETFHLSDKIVVLNQRQSSR